MNTVIVKACQTVTFPGPRARAAARRKPELNVAAPNRGGVQVDQAPGDDVDHAFFIERAHDLRCAAYRDVMKWGSSLFLRFLGVGRRS